MSQKLGKFFSIHSEFNNHIMCIQNGADVPGAFVVTSPKPANEKYADSQLWFVDPVTSSVRSKLNKFCLDVNVKDKKIILRPYSRSSKTQKWVLSEREIQTLEDFEMVIGLADDLYVYCMANDGSSYMRWKFQHSPAQFFKIRSQSSRHKILDVEKAKKEPGAKVIIWTDKGNLSDNQLWYEDQNGIIRSRLSGNVLDSAKKESIMLNPYDASKENRQWYLCGNTIRNRHASDRVLAVNKGAVPGIFNDVIQEERYDGEVNQLWTVEFLPDDTDVWNHGGYGRHFHIRNAETGLLFTLKDGGLAPMTEVVLSYKKTGQLDYDDQLFYTDDSTSTIRTSANKYCLEFIGNALVINPYDAFSKTQQWTVFGRKIISKNDPDKVLTAVLDKDTEAVYDLLEDEDTEGATAACAAPVQGHLEMTSYCGGELQHFDITHVKAKCFYIRSLFNNKVLDIKAQNSSVGAEITLWEPKKKVSFNQLWYEDERGILRSRLNGYVIQLTGRGAKTTAYDPAANDQHFIVFGDRIQNMHDTESVMEVNTKKGLGALGVVGAVASGKYDGDINQKWALDYV